MQVSERLNNLGNTIMKKKSQHQRSLQLSNYQMFALSLQIPCYFSLTLKQILEYMILNIENALLPLKLLWRSHFGELPEVYYCHGKICSPYLSVSADILNSFSQQHNKLFKNQKHIININA